MPSVSVIMPVYNVQAFVGAAVESVLAQTHTDFELLIVDDCSPDDSIAICESFTDPRIRILRHQKNRGLAGARNTGIRAARGDFLAFIDSDDLWTPDKLAHHLQHLQQNPQLGVSFSRSAFIDEHGAAMGVYQMPRLCDITPDHLLCRNPIGNGSAPVIRRAVFADIRYTSSLHGSPEDFYFDETFRRSEDIECWMRIALCTDWQIAGLAQPLTLYRLNAGGLSAALYQQLESWEQMMRKIEEYAPAFGARHAARARAFQLRYLARQAIRLRDGRAALKLTGEAVKSDWRILIHEPGRSFMTAAASILLAALPQSIYLLLESLGQGGLSRIQQNTIRKQIDRHAKRFANCEAS